MGKVDLTKVSLADYAKDEKIYPQASSFLLDTWEPIGHLKAREELYEKHLEWSKWTPKSMIDVGTGKGFHLKKWKSVKTAIGVEVNKQQANLVQRIAPDVAILAQDFMDVRTTPVDFILALRCVHYMYFPRLRYDYILKMATLCKDKLVIETCFTPENRRHGELIKRWKVEWPNEKNILLGHSEDDLIKYSSPFFRFVKKFPATYDGYVTYYFERKLPPFEEIGDQKDSFTVKRDGGSSFKRENGTWAKIGYEERTVLEYVTAMQVLGQEKNIISILTDNGDIVGIRQKDLGEQDASDEDCRFVCMKLLPSFLPIGLLPTDLIGINVRGRCPIDVSIFSYGSLKIPRQDLLFWRRRVENPSLK